MSRADYRLIQSAAKKQKIPAAEFIRRAALEAAGRPPGPDPLAVATAIRADRRRDLVTIGRNVNQIAAALNAAIARGLTPQGQLEVATDAARMVLDEITEHRDLILRKAAT